MDEGQEEGILMKFYLVKFQLFGIIIATGKSKKE